MIQWGLKKPNHYKIFSQNMIMWQETHAQIVVKALILPRQTKRYNAVNNVQFPVQENSVYLEQPCVLILLCLHVYILTLKVNMNVPLKKKKSLLLKKSFAYFYFIHSVFLKVSLNYPLFSFSWACFLYIITSETSLSNHAFANAPSDKFV